MKRLDVITNSLKDKEINTIAGDEVFELSDTFGFPVDLTALIAREKGFQIDEAGFQSALAEQKKGPDRMPQKKLPTGSNFVNRMALNSWVMILKKHIAILSSTKRLKPRPARNIILYSIVHLFMQKWVDRLEIQEHCGGMMV